MVAGELSVQLLDHLLEVDPLLRCHLVSGEGKQRGGVTEINTEVSSNKAHYGANDFVLCSHFKH